MTKQQIPMEIPLNITPEEMIFSTFYNVQALMMDKEQDRQNFNVFFRVLYEKGIITEEDIFNSLKKEYQTFYDLGKLSNIPTDNEINGVVKGMLLWIKLDKEELEKVFEEHKKELEEIERQRSSKIDVVSADALNMLNSKNTNKKLII